MQSKIKGGQRRQRPRAAGGDRSLRWRSREPVGQGVLKKHQGKRLEEIKASRERWAIGEMLDTTCALDMLPYNLCLDFNTYNTRKKLDPRTNGPSMLLHIRQLKRINPTNSYKY